MPDTHPYISAIQPDSVRHLRLTPIGATGWERSPLLDGSSVESKLAGVDLVHVHFGYEGLSPAELTLFIDGVRRSGRALVVTVHDLRKPPRRRPGSTAGPPGPVGRRGRRFNHAHPGAAAEIENRWSRAAIVVPHPTLMTGSEFDRPSPGRRARPVVGIHLKSLRTNVREPLRLVAAAAEGARDAGGVLQVNVHDSGVDRRC